MKRLAIFVILFLAGSALAFAEDAGQFSLFARSQRYSMNIDVVPLPGDHFDCNVTVTDLATNTVVAQPHLSALPATFDIDSGDVHLRMNVGVRAANLLAASLEATKGEMVIDSILAAWSIKPHPKVAGGFVAPHADRPLPPDTYRVGGDVRAPVVLHRVEPSYSDEARRARISGIVIVEALIDKTGAVRDVQVLKPLPYGLDQAAADAVKQWRFQPATRNGEPVNVIFNLTVNFKLDTGQKK